MENPSMCEIPIDPRDPPPSGTCCARGDAPRPCGAEDFFPVPSLLVSWSFFEIDPGDTWLPGGFPMVNSGSIWFNGGEYSGNIQRCVKHLVFTSVEL